MRIGRTLQKTGSSGSLGKASLLRSGGKAVLRRSGTHRCVAQFAASVQAKLAASVQARFAASVLAKFAVTL